MRIKGLLRCLINKDKEIVSQGLNQDSCYDKMSECIGLETSVGK